jgi:hypothetical protein
MEQFQKQAYVPMLIHNNERKKKAYKKNYDIETKVIDIKNYPI